MAGEADGFFSRWSRRKAQAVAAVPLPDGPAPTAAGAGTVAGSTSASAAVVAAQTPATAVRQTPGGPAGGSPAAQAPDAAPTPSLEDVAKLTTESDFSPFVGRAVPADVKNAAMKKLFADPRFNVMDGLDIYIDDYSKPDPLPAEWLKQMVSAQVMKLVEEEAPPTASPAEARGQTQPQTQTPEAAPHADVAPSAEPPHLPPPAAHDHPDLQLQPDHATRRGGTEPGAG